MSEMNWRQVLVTSSLVMAVLLFAGSLYLHIQVKHHLGRMRFVNRHNDLNNSRYKNNSNTLRDIDDDDDQLMKFARIIGESPVFSAESSDTMSSESFLSESDSRSDDDDEEEIRYDNFDVNRNYHDVDEQVDDATDWNLLNETLRDTTIVVDVSGCLKCLCKLVNNCQPTLCRGHRACGIFGISQPYWETVQSDSMHLVQSLDGNHRAYEECVNDVVCAARTILNFFDMYKLDCNQDGQIDCRDLIKLHLMGYTSCTMGQLLTTIQERHLEMCISRQMN